MQFQIDSMTCGGCVRSVTKAIQALDAAAQVTADISAHTVQVQTTVTQAAVVAALDEAGFPAQVL